MQNLCALADVLFYNFETGALAIGEPIYGPEDYYNDYPSPYTYQPFPHLVNYTFLGPYNEAANTTDPAVRLYINTLLRIQYYAELIAFGPYVPLPSNYPDCISG